MTKIPKGVKELDKFVNDQAYCANFVANDYKGKKTFRVEFLFYEKYFKNNLFKCFWFMIKNTFRIFLGK